MNNKQKIILSIFFGLLILQTSQAQLKDVGKMVSGITQAPQDAEKLFAAYLKPYSNAFGANLNGGWYNTAKNHKLGGFDLTFTISTSFVPSADKSFDASKLGLTGTVTPTTNATSPTIAGEKKEGATIGYLSNQVNFKTPKGTGVGFIPTPMLQLGIGLIKETDVTVRYLPNLNIGDYGGLQMWGVGIKHSIKQWIPGIKHAPFFHLAFFGGYTQLKTNVNLDFKPSFYSNSVLDASISNKTFDNQKMEMQINGLTFNVLASFDLPVVTFYGGVGLSNTKTTLKMLGDYPLPTLGTGANAGKLVIVNSPKNPIIDIEMKNSDGSKTKPRLNAGIKFKMAIITLHFDYTYANYSVATAGLGISFR